MNKDLKKIKEKYGEKMMHLCRDLFPTLLEKEGLLTYLMESHFYFSKNLYDDIIDNQMVDEFKNYIYSLSDLKLKKIVTNKSPKELLKEAGYDLYECKTEEEIQSFKKYYKPGEELCTFNGRRLERCHVFFAVKENANEIKREDFKSPERQDDYGVSVISIQFTKGDVNTVSIKNRYNHTVDNPDATFFNNLDNIILGLTNGFENVYGFNINENSINFEIPGYVKASDGKYYKYNYEINNIYYCPNNIIIDNFEVIKKYEEKEKYIILDYFILDLKNKIISLYDQYIDDSFICGLNNINNIEIIKSKDNKKIFINGKTIEIVLDKINRIISYSNPNITEISYDFLSQNIVLESINIPNVKKIGFYFLFSNECLMDVNLPNVEKIGHSFLFYNNFLMSLNLPKLKSIECGFLYNNKSLVSINIPKIEEVDNEHIQNLLNSKQKVKKK